MADDVPIPIVPYLCGALAATALVARWNRCGSACSGGDRDPGIVRLAAYTVIVLAATWIWFTDWFDRSLGFMLYLGADWVLMDRGERAAVGRRLTEPMTGRQILVSLLPLIVLLGTLAFMALVVWNPAARPAGAGRPAVPAAADPVGAALSGAMIVFFTTRLPGLWWRKIAAGSRVA